MALLSRRRALVFRLVLGSPTLIATSAFLAASAWWCCCFYCGCWHVVHVPIAAMFRIRYAFLVGVFGSIERSNSSSHSRGPLEDELWNRRRLRHVLFLGLRGCGRPVDFVLVCVCFDGKWVLRFVKMFFLLVVFRFRRLR
jgi:hypothetical protein